MSDTPRTDEAQFGTGRVSVSFARQLERELNAANVEIEEKRKDVVWLATEKAKLEEQLMDTKNKHSVLIADVVLNEDKAEQIKRLRKANLQLREGAEEQKQRIKRLEEAGDAMFLRSTRVGREIWKEAKEAKL